MIAGFAYQSSHKYEKFVQNSFLKHLGGWGFQGALSLVQVICTASSFKDIAFI
jgi:hypothetical protein